MSSATTWRPYGRPFGTSAAVPSGRNAPCQSAASPSSYGSCVVLLWLPPRAAPGKLLFWFQQLLDRFDDFFFEVRIRRGGRCLGLRSYRSPRNGQQQGVVFVEPVAAEFGSQARQEQQIHVAGQERPQQQLHRPCPDY